MAKSSDTAACTTLAIPGLSYIHNFITADEETTLMAHIIASPWNTSITRRTQHYGWTYPYNQSNRLIEAPPIPDWLLPLKSKLEAFIKTSFDQVIINEYTPGQGISPHIDNPRLFGEPVVSVSLGSHTTMCFKSPALNLLYNVVLERRSAIVLEGDARYRYTHEIPKRKNDEGRPRKTRISITFRRVRRSSDTDSLSDA